MKRSLQRTILSTGIALMGSLGVTPAQEPTAQIWRELGAGSASNNGISNETLGDAGPPSAAVDVANGQIYVAWEAGKSEVYVRKWTGTGWEQVGPSSVSGGGVSNTAGKSRFPSVAVGPDHLPVVAWLDDSSGQWEVYVRKFNPTANAWTGIAGSGEGGGISTALGGIASPEDVQPVVAVGTNNQIYVAWGKNAVEKHVYVSTLTDAGWRSLGGSVDISSAEYLSEAGAPIPSYLGASRPALALGAENAPVVAYITQSSTSSGDLHVRRWGGTGWVALGTGGATNAGISAVGPHNATGYTLGTPRLAFASSGQWYVAWLYADAEQKLVQVRRLDGGTWVNAGPAISTPAAVIEGGIGFGFTSDNAALVAWAEDLPVASPIGNVEIYSKKLGRTSTGEFVWQEFGLGSASGGGISSNPGQSAYPFLAFARSAAVSNAPVLAWLDGSDSTEPLAAQVYVRRAQPVATTVEFTQPTFNVTEGMGQALITVIRKGGLSGETRVSYATDGGTATAGADYTAVSGQLVFAANETTKTFAIPIAKDDAVEEKETVGLVLREPSAGTTLGQVRSASLVISDAALPPTTSAGQLQFRLASYTVNEGAGSAVIEVVRSGGADGEVSVHFETAAGPASTAGTATGGADFTPASGTLSFANGVTSRTFEVPILEDSLVEGNEMLGLRLSNPTGGATLGAASASLTIADNDKPATAGTIQFNPAEYHIAETGGSVQLRVTRSGDTTAAASLIYFTLEQSTAAGVATPGVDFELASGTLSFEPGQAEKIISVAIKTDDVVEGNEFFAIGLREPQGATLGSAAVARVIIDGTSVPPTVQPGVLGFATGEFRVVENAGQAVITVVRRDGSTGEVTVKYATTDATLAEHPATAGDDYTTTSGVLTFAAGETTKTFTVPITNDTQAETSEVLSLTLSDPTGGAVIGAATAKATLVIADDDQAPGRLQFAAEQFRVREGSGSITLIVGRQDGGAGQVSVAYKTADGTAKAGSDYTATAGTLTFAAGQLSKAIIIPVQKDANAEGPETFSVTLSEVTGGATLGTPATATVSIVDAEPAGVLQFARAEYGTGENAGTATITVVRTEGAAGEVSVDYATADGTAVNGEDYTVTSGTLLFAAGEKSKSFTVPIINDTKTEGPESLNLLLSAPSGGAVLGVRNMAKLTITDNDIAARLQFASKDFRVREDSDAHSALITVIRRGSAANPVRVKYATADGTATAGGDYTATSGVLEFAAGQTIKSFRVPINRDAVPEGTESVQLTLSEPDGAVLGPPASATLTIVDPDAKNGSVQFAAPEFVINEAAGTATIVVTRMAGSTGAISVKYRTTAGTATETDDFTPVSGELNFAAGEAKKTFTVPIIADDAAEGPETILLELSDPTGGALLGTPARAVLTIIEVAPVENTVIGVR